MEEVDSENCNIDGVVATRKNYIPDPVFAP